MRIVVKIFKYFSIILDEIICLLHFRADRKIKHCRIKLEGRLYTIGNVEFESLVDLINFYENHPLYGRVKLSHAISEEMVRKMNTVSLLYYSKNIYIYLMIIAQNRPL